MLNLPWFVFSLTLASGLWRTALQLDDRNLTGPEWYVYSPEGVVSGTSRARLIDGPISFTAITAALACAFSHFGVMSSPSCPLSLRPSPPLLPSSFAPLRISFSCATTLTLGSMKKAQLSVRCRRSDYFDQQRLFSRPPSPSQDEPSFLASQPPGGSYRFLSYSFRTDWGGKHKNPNILCCFGLSTFQLNLLGFSSGIPFTKARPRSPLSRGLLNLPHWRWVSSFDFFFFFFDKICGWFVKFTVVDLFAVQSGAYKVSKEGFILLQFAPAGATRQYDWSRKQVC